MFTAVEAGGKNDEVGAVCAEGGEETFLYLSSERHATRRRLFAAPATLPAAIAAAGSAGLQIQIILEGRVTAGVCGIERAYKREGGAVGAEAMRLVQSMDSQRRVTGINIDFEKTKFGKWSPAKAATDYDFSRQSKPAYRNAWIRAVCNDDTITGPSNHLAHLLNYFVNSRSGLCCPAQDTLAKTGGISGTVKRSLSALERAG